MIRFGSLLLFLVYAFVAAQGNDGIELPVPISDVIERLVELEKRLLVQEQKNVDLEKRLVDQEKLNKVQTEIIRKLSTCDCASKGKETFSGDDRNKFSVDPYPSDVESATTIEDIPVNTTISENQTKGRQPLRSFKQILRRRSIGQPSLGHTESATNSKRATTGQVAFYAYMSHIQEGVGHHQTFIFDHVITNVGGNYNQYSGMFTSPSHGFYVFSWTLYCQRNGYFVSEVVANSQAVGSLYCDAQGADGARHITGVVVVEINQGDVVFVRTHPLYPNSGNVYSSDFFRSSFTGWKMF